MLATRVRLARYVATGAALAIGLLAWHTHRSVVSPPTPKEPNDTIQVVLHEAAEWTGIVIESDWAKSYRVVWDGPIQTWTTMRLVRVPSLDHRMIESIEPLWVNSHGGVRRLRIKARVVVPGDLEAALEWIRANPAVQSANVEMMDAR